MAAGLPPKPYVPPTAPAPPLPAGPAPQAYTQDPAAAHAAAWAAYYQSQGLTAQGQPQPAGYTAQAQPQAQAGPQQPGAANPYANYGYGAQAAQAHLGGPTPQGYRPPAQQGYQYPQQPAAGYASPASTPYQAPHQGYAQPQQPQGYTAPAQAWGQGPQQPQQGYRPPAQPFNGAPGQQPYFNGGPQQPYTPPHNGGQTPYRSSPGMNQNRPYAPQAQPMAPRQRPPMNQGPTPPHHPPAKRPRFDGPPNQGPTHLGGPRNASLPVRPGSIPNRPPSGPRTPLPPPPITRPPIHLGSGGPPPVFAPGGPRGLTPSRGGRGGGRGGMVMNAPRGPSHMRRERQESQRQRSAKEQSPSKRDKKDKKKEKEKDNAKTTLTDFRIVGIEMKELGWSWGLVGEEAMNQVEEEEKVVEEEAKVAGNGDVKAEEDVQEEVASTEPTTTEEVKQETNDAEVEVESEVKAENQTGGDSSEVKDEPSTEQADAPKEQPSTTELEDSEGKGKTGGKRKAQSPETDEGSSKKRSTYLLTHGKANEDSPSQESKNNQNRFRIYFESPPEADRIPQALRRNPYKRWRREDSALPATGGEKEGELAAIEETEQETSVAPEQAATEADVAGLNSEGTAKNVPTSDAIPETGAAAEVVEAASTTEVEGTGPTPAENGHTETDTQANETAEQAVPEVSIETNVEVPATTAEEAPTTTEPPKEDELPIPAEQTSEVDQSTQEPSAPTEVNLAASADAGPSSTTEAAAESSTAAADANPADEAADPSTTTDAVAPTATPASAEETAAAIALSAENAASAYKSRTRRRSSVSSTDSRETLNAFQPEVTPSMNRLSILYEGSQRRMCFDAEVVERIEVWREEGRIEVIFTPPKLDEEENTLLPKGYLLEEYNQEDQRFAPVSKERLDEIYGNEEATDSIPPLHRHFVSVTSEDSPKEETTNTGLRLNVYLNKKNPLSVPRWCRNNSADEWLYEQFGSKHSAWKAKLVVMDPDPPPTLASILENWSSSSNLSSSQKRNTFISSLLSDPHDLLEILLRLTRGDRNPPAPLANAIRADSPYATHQTHVSLAILAMYRLTTDYAVQAGVDLENVNEKIGDIIKSLPTNLIGRSLDGMFKEWDGRKK